MNCNELENIEVPEDINSEQELLDLWEKQTEYFVRDGIFSTDDFEDPKILFVLRDAHIVTEKATPPYDIRDIAKHPEGEGRTWNNVARWTRALLDGASYSEVETITSDVLSAQLKRVAAINLKKKAGKGNAERISEFACKHKSYIKKQLEIINPDLIIACGTYSDIKRNVYENKRRNNSFISGTKYKKFIINLKSKEVPVVEFYHPKYNKRNKDLTEDMLKIRELIK